METIRFDRAGRRLVSVASDRKARTFAAAGDSVEPLYPPRPPITGQFRGLARAGRMLSLPGSSMATGVLLTVRRWEK